MKLTEFTLYKNVPLTNFQDEFIFKSNEERDNFFNTKYDKIIKVQNQEYNYIRDKLTVNLNIDYLSMMGVTYGSFISDFEPNLRYYFYVMNYEYGSNGYTKVDMVIDEIMTFCQGYTLNNLENLQITREHLSTPDYNKYLLYLKNNDDLLKTSTNQYIKTTTKVFKTFDVIFQCSADLSKEFGTEDKPLMPTSKGLQFDKIISPVDIYRVAETDFNSLMDALSDYPWIAQNISKVIQIPALFIANDSYEKVTMKSGKFDKLYRFKNKSMSDKVDFTKLNMTMDELLSVCGLSSDEKHLLKTGYFNIELNTWDGNSVGIDVSQLEDNVGFKLSNKVVTGYGNNVSVYVTGYRGRFNTSDTPEVDYGSFMNNAMTFSTFDTIPLLINSYDLNQAKTANVRGLENSKQLTNRVDNVLHGRDLKSRFMDAVSLTSNISPSNLFGKFTDEYEYYRTQRAQQADMKLTVPEVSEQTTFNALKVANDFYGLTVKVSGIDENELNKIRKYHGAFGFEMNLANSQLSDVFSMTLCNYVQFTGNYFIPEIPIGFLEQMRARFENGVRLWHPTTADPFNEDLANNRRK